MRHLEGPRLFRQLEMQKLSTRDALFSILLARVVENCLCGSLRSPQRALPTETNVENVTFQSKSGTYVNLSNSGLRSRVWGCVPDRSYALLGTYLEISQGF